MTTGGSDRTGSDAADVERLRAELAEAQDIARWLYDRVPFAVRVFLGDVSEWPYLGHSASPSKGVPVRFARADRDRAFLRAFALTQAAGRDPYDAAHTDHIATRLNLTTDEFNATLARLIHAGLLTGGQLPSRAYVETVTPEGMRLAGMVDAAGIPLSVIRTDLAGFSGSGYGQLRVPTGVQLAPGQTVLVTDDEADVLEARVIKVNGDTAQVQVYWDKGRHPT